RTRSSSPLEKTELPPNRRSRSPPRVADAARSPSRDHAGLGKGRGKHARDEETLEVEGPAEEAGGESFWSSVARPAKRLRAGDRGGEAIRRQMEREKRSTPPPTAPVTTPSGVRASVLRVGASALKYLGFRTESPRPVAEGDGHSSPSPEVSSREAPGSTAESPSGQEAVKSTDGPSGLDGSALAPAVLHERSGEQLIEEQRRAAELRKLLRLGRRNVVPKKAPSECGSDDEEAAKAAYRFTEELRPVSLPSFEASTRYVGWTEGNGGMLVVEEDESDDSEKDPKGKRTDLFSSSPLSPVAASADPTSLSAALSVPVPLSAAPGVSNRGGRKLVQFPITNTDILKAVKTALGWFNEHSDTVPTPEELVGVLGKYRFEQLSTTTSRTYRAPSPSDPYADFEYESDTGNPIDRCDGRTPPPPINQRRRKITARSVQDFGGSADAHLPISLRGLPFHSLPEEWKGHEKSWKIRQRDEIVAAQLADRRARGIDEDDFQMGLRAADKAEKKRRKREAEIVAAGKAVNDRIRLSQLRAERIAMKALAEEKRAEAAKAAGVPPATRAPRLASLPRCPTISEEADEAAFTVAAGPTPKTAAAAAAAPTAPRPVPAYPAEWAGREINPKTNLPYGTFGYDINFFSDSDSDDEEPSPATATTTTTPAANAGVSGVDVDVGALVDSIPSHELKALLVVHDVDEADVDIASIVDTISRDDLEALLGIPLPLASESHDNDAAANFAISDDVMAIVDAITASDFDEMMGGILA
ncbi:hypothetical protein V492_03499, partial [Pseudogymnoascus sp. VKM F-4246]